MRAWGELATQLERSSAVAERRNRKGFFMVALADHDAPRLFKQKSPPRWGRLPIGLKASEQALREPVSELAPKQAPERQERWQILAPRASALERQRVSQAAKSV